MSNDNEKVIHAFGAHDYMTQEQVFGLASSSKWEKLIVVGYTENSGEDLVLYSVNCSRKDGLWISEDLQDAIRGRLEKE